MEKVNIQDFYTGRSVFITGASGFLGKVLVEKLLRSCPGIDRLYLLIRPTSGKDAVVRLQELINCKAFERLKLNQPEALEKLVPINGDVSLPDLGLSSSDLQKLIDNVSVVFHLAARVKFDDNLRSTIETNVKGTQRVAHICQQLKELKAFVHVSTTYNNMATNEIAEEIHPASLDPQKLMDLVDSMDDQLLSSITKQLLGGFPNAYSFAKAHGEQLLLNYAQCGERSLPIVVVRPSTVICALKEPLAGWIDNFYGCSGVIAGTGKGLIHVSRGNAKLILDLIPVDIVINLLIAAAWHKGTSDKSREKIEVYNCSSGSLNPITWGEFKRLAMRGIAKFPFKEMVRCPSAQLHANWLAYQVSTLLYHYLPAVLMDTVILLSGGKPFLIRLYKKIHKVSACIDFYALREWNFASRNPGKLMDEMSFKDQEIFNFDVRKIDWEACMEDFACGVRTFVFKDDLSTLPEARNKLKRMKRLRTLTRLIFVGITLFLFYFLWCYTRTSIAPLEYGSTN
ncbi:hypothetical protein GHT06_018867 [Daphnia sinensis]|uniref:Fatty acyl-CoA reductase n=1 Tax=Daphnia sinensis TaxID=1820382 RepID=A0AAD5LEN4_9CRUS|nr:hypothetical protein GHT06_018867 [Daphnia sinensis]